MLKTRALPKRSEDAILCAGLTCFALLFAVGLSHLTSRIVSLSTIFLMYHFSLFLCYPLASITKLFENGTTRQLVLDQTIDRR